MRRVTCAFTVSFAALLAISLTPAYALRYQITDLGTLGGYESYASAINSSGSIVGMYGTYENGYSQMRAFACAPGSQPVDIGNDRGTWYDASMINDAGQIGGWCQPGFDCSYGYRRDPDGGINMLSDLGGNHTSASGLNEAGTLVGTSEIDSSTGTSHAVCWTLLGGTVDLHPTSTTANRSAASGINDSGQMIGKLVWADGRERAIIWPVGSYPFLLPTLGGTWSDAYAINNAGQVIGDSTTSDGKGHAFLWSQQGGIVDLGALAGGRSEARALNALGEVAGISDFDSTGTDHAVFWGTDHSTVDLGTLGGKSSSVRALNDLGLVVGQSEFSMSGYYQHAFAWTAADGMVDLGTLGGNWSGAVAVNNSGWIVGYAETADHRYHAVLWTPVPEPSSFVGLASALGTMLLVRRRRSKPRTP